MFAASPRFPPFKINCPNFPENACDLAEALPATPDLDQLVDLLSHSKDPNLDIFGELGKQKMELLAGSLPPADSRGTTPKSSFTHMTASEPQNTLKTGFPFTVLTKRERVATSEEHGQPHFDGPQTRNHFKRQRLENVSFTPSASAMAAMASAAAEKTKRNESSWKVWTKTEEIFLVGAVFELLFERGSLTASNDRSEVWQTVKEKYDATWEKYARYRCRLSGEANFDPDDRSCTSLRSSKALYRHYKVLKERVAGNSTNAPPAGTNGKFCFRKYYYAYQTILAKISPCGDQLNYDDILDDVL